MAGGWGCFYPSRLPRGEQSRRAVGDDLFLLLLGVVLEGFFGGKMGVKKGQNPLLDT
jgi:hypothetical protein